MSQQHFHSRAATTPCTLAVARQWPILAGAAFALRRGGAPGAHATVPRKHRRPGQERVAACYDDDAAGMWQQPALLACSAPERAEENTASPAHSNYDNRTPSPTTSRTSHPHAHTHHHSPLFSNIGLDSAAGSSPSCSSSSSPDRDEEVSISSKPPTLPLNVRLVHAPAASIPSPDKQQLLTPDPWDASSDDEAVPIKPPTAAAAERTASRRPSGGRKVQADSKGVKPHSGLEAQDAADYERRLDQQEARDALVGVTRSGMSSDDEDSGGLDYSTLIARQTELAKQARQRKQRGRRSTTAKHAQAPLGSSDTSSSSSSGGSDSDDAPPTAVALAAQLLLSGGSEGDEPVPDAAHPNRFAGVPLEPPEPGSVLLAAELLAGEEAQRQQQQREGARSLEGLLQQQESSYGGSQVAGLAAHTTGPLRRLSGVEDEPAVWSASGSVTSSVEEEDQQLVAAVLGPGDAAWLEGSSRVELRVAQDLAALRRTAAGDPPAAERQS